MRKKVILMWSLFAAMTFSACTENEDAPETENVEFSIELDFSGSAGTRAASTNAIPVTSWDIIDKIQFFLYDKTTGVVKFSAVETPTAGNFNEGNPPALSPKKKYVYTSVPAGTYKLVAVASTTAKPLTNITPFGATNDAAWDKFNVLDKNISSLYMTHKAIVDGDNDPVWPAFMDNTEFVDPATAMIPYQEPAEIFLGTTLNDADVVVTGNQMNSAAITLTREVSLMRVRIDVKSNANVAFAGTGADASSVLIRHLPEKMNIGAGTAGGVNSVYNATTLKAVQFITEGINTFKTADPVVNAGYGADASKLKIVDANFKLWRDIIVFPNSDRAAQAVTAGGNAIGNRKYLITVTGKAKAGHTLADGTPAVVGSTVYWTGIIDDKFLPNQIREVNISLNTGGYEEPPVTEFGDLTIVVNEPTPWDNNIVTSIVEM
ncbi:FimB/Mfa2 family fimbrial subunit [Bacteroides sp. UBA939]|uniref:FimB/Mfa2 family fimbrial subunit n=1 Tax=Bacteroides sp. UBA939 TaxID=1946092 RepID=UPI0025C60AA0|nr:FimB/Mfa2 family fimbrial subunit [Bacteroides sp. UBA939]